MISIETVTYLDTQNQSHTGYYEGFDHKQTGELLITNEATGHQVYIRPERVTRSES